MPAGSFGVTARSRQRGSISRQASNMSFNFDAIVEIPIIFLRRLLRYDTYARSPNWLQGK